MKDRPLRGARYLREGMDDFAAFLTGELPYLDYGRTVRAYAELAKQPLTPADMALWGCNDRFYLLTGLLGRKDALHPWLFERCREVEVEPDGFLDLWAREHYKSTIITFAGTLQEVLTDPNLTVGIFSHTKDIARKFLAQIKRELEGNALLRAAYRDAVWEKPISEAPTWSVTEGLVLRRDANPKEPSVSAWGLIDGMPTSMHFGLLVYDDVIEQKAVGTPEQIQKATEAWELSDNLSAGKARKWHTGTRYTFADTYGVMLERQVLKPRIYPATDNGKPDGNPVLISRKRWEEKKRLQRSTLAAQMLQNPLAGSEQTFRVEWLRPWEVRPVTLNVYILCDPSRGRSAKSDRTAVAVIGVDANGNKYFLDGARHRMKLSERWAVVRDLRRKWIKADGVKTVRVGYERYGQQTDDEYFQERMRAEGESFEIVELAWPREGGHSKNQRIERLEPDMRLSRFYLPAVVWHADHHADRYWRVEGGKIVYSEVRGPTRAMKEAAVYGQDYRSAKAIKRLDETRKPYDVTRAFFEEALFHPFGTHDDLIDAASRVYDMNPTTPAPWEDEAASDMEEFDDA